MYVTSGILERTIETLSEKVDFLDNYREARKIISDALDEAWKSGNSSGYSDGAGWE